MLCTEVRDYPHHQVPAQCSGTVPRVMFSRTSVGTRLLLHVLLLPILNSAHRTYQMMRWTCAQRIRRRSFQSKGSHPTESELQVPPSTISCHNWFPHHTTLLICLHHICMAASSSRPYYLVWTQTPLLRHTCRAILERCYNNPQSRNFSIGHSLCCWWVKSV